MRSIPNTNVADDITVKKKKPIATSFILTPQI